MKKRLRAADLFCGAGGSSTGIQQFCDHAGLKLDLVAVNHWERAVETHSVNHPTANHFCQDLTRLKPVEAVPGRKLDLLVASPECTHHSVARGGKPKNDQSRASAWIVLEWINALQIDRVLIENVPEFQSWGPLGVDGKPLKSKRGETFQAFIHAIESSGYRVGWRVLNAANYGAATSRRRLFIQAVKGRRPLLWPNQTHEKSPVAGLFGSLPKWRAAREVIDWSIQGNSIFNRKKPLSLNTLERIEAGFKKFGGEIALVEPFILPHRQFQQMDTDSVEQPLRTITATNGGCNAIIIPFYGNSQADETTKPLATVTTKDRFGLCEAEVKNKKIDILFRMLQPHELSAAMGFPPNYKITGNREEQVKQIGNAVEVNQSRSLVQAMMGGKV